MALTHFVQDVDAMLGRLTHGVIDLSCLVDFSDGEYSLSEMFAEGLTPKEAAIKLLSAQGFQL